MKSNAEVDITTLAEYWSHPPKLSLGCGPLPVLQTFRGKKPFSRRGCGKERVIVLGRALELLTEVF